MKKKRNLWGEDNWLKGALLLVVLSVALGYWAIWEVLL